MILRIFLFIAIALTLYILWVRKSARDPTSESASHQQNTRVLLIGFSVLACIVVFIITAELVTRL